MFTLPDTVPFRYRVVAIPYTPAVPYLTSGPNHPIHVLKDWLNGSKASLNLGGAKGTIMAPGFTLGSAGYNFSPFDLASANNGLGLPTPTVVNLTHPPDFVANNPRALYGPPNIAATDSFQLATEATLDIQMMSQYAQGSGATDGFFSPNASMSPAEAYNNTFLLGQLEMILLSPPPDVITLSEGGPQLASNLMTSLSKLAAQGVTVIASSGDSGPFMNLGSGGLYTATCKDAVLPSYPAASPWVTAVGSVMQLRTSPNNSKPQLVATMSLAGSFCSGGGFGILDSHIPSSPLPKWQKKVVLNYIANQSGHPSWPLNTKFNPLTSYSVNISSCSLIDKMTGKISGCSYGRGYPDLALMGQSIPIVTSGQFGFVGGTSASAPAFAGLVAQLNSAVRSTPGLHNQTMGWMNPFLYWAAENYPNAFTDITIGSSNQDSSGNVCLLGYRAAVGWDAVSGLGVPNIAVLQQAAIKYVTLQSQGSIAPYFYNYYNVEYDPNAGGTYGGPPSDYDYYAAGKK